MKLQNEIRVRFAPSPTGSLHVGGARTALFNYLFARHHGGKFLLRIEDTDIARSQGRLTEGILESLHWLGLKWDGDIVYQSNRINKYREICQHLLNQGFAYRCFCTPEELQKKREIAKRDKKELQYDRSCLRLTDSEIQNRYNAGFPYTIRFRVPEGVTSFTDLIHGKTSFQNSTIEDFIILRSDGNPVYQVAVVVDDHDMTITHVIRGDDHLTNTPKQILLYKVLNWSVPLFAHVPMILGQDKKRLSKRQGASSVIEFREAGFLSETLVNFIALLGWAPGDDREIFSLEELVQAFTLERISKKSAIFDEVKLEWMNSQYVMKMDKSRLYTEVVKLLQNAHLISQEFDEPNRITILKIIKILQTRVKKLNEFVTMGLYFFKEPTSYDESAVKKYWLKEGVKDRLIAVQSCLECVQSWNGESLEKVVRDLAEESSVGAGVFIHPMRVALTGIESSPGLFEVMEILGREKVLKRLAKAIQFLK